MTDLQASLIAIGGTIVVGVISYNKWQEHKARKSVERAFSAQGDDVLMRSGSDTPARDRNEGSDARHHDGVRQEPRLAAETDTGPAAHFDSTDSIIPGADSVPATAPAPPATARQPTQKELPVDPMIDCVIPLALDGPVRGEKVLPLLQSLRHVGSKPVHFIGQLEHGEWEEVAYGSVYVALQAGVQLANRGSALNELEYSELVMRLRQLADDLGAEPDVPDMIQVMSGAREVHQFIAEYDAQLSVNVQSSGNPWAINTLLAALERQGFDLRPDGRLVMPDGDSGVLFSLSTNVTLAAETTSRLTLLLDVPRVAPAKDGFGAMAACARSLAARLDGVVVDDAGQPLSEATLAEIASQVRNFYADMENAEIPAGSTRALRLFS